MPENNREPVPCPDLTKVLVLETDQVFGGVVLNLIANQDRLIATSLQVDALTDLLEEVPARRPDVVVVDDSIFSHISNQLLPLLQKIPCLKIIVLCRDENKVEVYTKQQTTISRSQDFFNLLYQSLIS